MVKNRVLDSPRHSYVPASSNWTFLIFKQRPLNSSLPPDLISAPLAPLYHEIFWPSLVSTLEHFTVSVLPMLNTWCFFSSTVLFSEIDVSQIGCGSYAMKEGKKSHVDNWYNINNLSYIPKTYLKIKWTSFQLMKQLLCRWNDCLWCSIYTPPVLSAENYSWDDRIDPKIASNRNETKENLSITDYKRKCKRKQFLTE